MRSTRLATVALAWVALLLVVFDREILTAWLGASYAAKAAPILKLIVLGHALRQLAFPYATLLLATKQHGQLLLSPLVEGVTNLVVAVIAGSLFGARGVAMAVIAGAIVSQVMNYCYNLPRTHGPAFDRGRLLRQSIVRPLLCFLPLAPLAFLGWLNVSQSVSLVVRGILLLVCLVLAWNFALDADEQRIVWTVLNRGRALLRKAAT